MKALNATEKLFSPIKLKGGFETMTNEYRILAGQIVAGQQPKLEEIICEHLETESIDTLTVFQIVGWLQDNKEYTAPFIS